MLVKLKVSKRTTPGRVCQRLKTSSTQKDVTNNRGFCPCSLNPEHLRTSCTNSKHESRKFFELTKSWVKGGKLTKEKAKKYLSEILHSVFFIGHINIPSIEPDMILSGEKNSSLKKRLEEVFPDVFKNYTTHLPLRTPFSILLDVVAQIAGDQSLDELLEVNKKMQVPQDNGQICGNDFCLAATVVSYCYFEDKNTNKKSQRYFGASVACTGKAKRDFFINLSCIKTWNRKVALGVCMAAKGKKSILLPKTVYSAAFTLLNDQRDDDRGGHGSGQRYAPRAPCQKCWVIFPDVVFSPAECDEKAAQWKHGNCAECEAMSKLLNGESTVDGGVEFDEPPKRLTTDAANVILQPLLRARIDNIKNILKKRVELGQELVYYEP
ncbi:hypothetical protein AGOR_G00226140 [Albula goreensis]|uniref:Uncharacterized protein n=1 Tax=Albula goreensis TaxID=1534307 RepID=A0A8T3CLL9_9TELE|nr:hypothetical protein AGOR_G00226140 [Albula goreensis]